MHGLASSQTLGVPESQPPPLHLSSIVQALPSLQNSVFTVKTQPLALLQLSSVHKLPSLQASKLPAAHSPNVQMSPEVHALLSSQGKLFATFLQLLLPGRKFPLCTGSCRRKPAESAAMQTPLAHTSPLVQALLSSQTFELLVKLQPLALSHTSSVQGLLSLQTTAFPLAHAPAAQASPAVHASPSSHALALNA